MIKTNLSISRMSSAPPFSLHTELRICVKVLPLPSAAVRVSIVPWMMNILSWCSGFIIFLSLKIDSSLGAKKKFYLRQTTRNLPPLDTFLQQSRVIVIFSVFILLSSTLMSWMLVAMVDIPVPRTHSPAESWVTRGRSSSSEGFSFFSSLGGILTVTLSFPWPDAGLDAKF